MTIQRATSSPSRRRELPYRRAHEVLDMDFRGRAYSVGVGRFEDGSLAEVFIDPYRHSTDAADDARDGALVLSLALQHGAGVDTIRHAVTRNTAGEPAGIIGAALDLIARHEQRPGPAPEHPFPVCPDLGPPPARGDAGATAVLTEARLKGYAGEACPECGNFTLVRNGVCMKCDTCGATTGCS